MKNILVHRRVIPMAILLLFGMPLILDNALLFNIANLIGIYALAALGLVVLTGYAGQISLGQAGFYAIGAYGSVLLMKIDKVPSVTAIVGAAAIAALLAFIVGRTILRLQGHFLAMATLAFGLVVYIILSRNIVWFGGPDGIQTGELSLFGFAPTASWHWYICIYITFGAGYWILRNVLNSKIGRGLAAVSESEITAEIVGVDPGRYKLLAFIIGAIYASVAGSLYGFYAGFITPDEAGLMHSFEFLIMVLIGGSRSLIGTLFGAAFIVGLPHLLNRAVDYEMIITGFILLMVIMFLPDGVTPSIKRLSQRVCK